MSKTKTPFQLKTIFKRKLKSVASRLHETQKATMPWLWWGRLTKGKTIVVEVSLYTPQSRQCDRISRSSFARLHMRRMWCTIPKRQSQSSNASPRINVCMSTKNRTASPGRSAALSRVRGTGRKARDPDGGRGTGPTIKLANTHRKTRGTQKCQAQRLIEEVVVVGGICGSASGSTYR